jgi:hypothetical protein
MLGICSQRGQMYSLISVLNFEVLVLSEPQLFPLGCSSTHYEGHNTSPRNL